MKPWGYIAISMVAGVSVMAVVYALSSSSRRRDRTGKTMVEDNAPASTTRVAFIGNSIFYYNDCPRLLQRMVTGMIQNSCLRGGASLVSLPAKGNGMQVKFGSDNALTAKGEDDIGAPTVQDMLKEKWDFVLMNDHTQQPAREFTRQETVEALKRVYAPLLKECGAIPVFLQTAAYREEDIRDTEDLGNAEEFTRRLQEGYEVYQKVLAKELSPEQQPRVAPAGNAFLHVYRNNVDLWNKLFWTDSFHPSPYGTWLQACVIYCTLFDQAPPVYNKNWWDTARYFPNEKMDNKHFPSPGEAHELREVACAACGIGEQCEDPLPDPQ